MTVLEMQAEVIKAYENEILLAARGCDYAIIRYEKLPEFVIEHFTKLGFKVQQLEYHKKVHLFGSCYVRAASISWELK